MIPGKLYGRKTGAIRRIIDRVEIALLQTARQGVAGLALVQAGVDAPPQLQVLVPVEPEQRALDLAYLLEGLRQAVLRG